MTLKEYLKENHLSQEQFAQVLGVSQPAVFKWANGYARPKHKYMVDILVATNGKVTANDFFYYMGEYDGKKN